MSAWGYWVLVLAGLVALVYLLDKAFAWAARSRDLEDDEPLAQVHRLERAREAIRRQTSTKPRWYPLDEDDDDEVEPYAGLSREAYELWLLEHPEAMHQAELFRRWPGLSPEERAAEWDRYRRDKEAGR